MDIYASNEADEQGALMFSSGCLAVGDCDSVDQRETAYLAAKAVTNHYLLGVYVWDGDSNNQNGGTFKYEISNGVDSRCGAPHRPAFCNPDGELRRPVLQLHPRVDRRRHDRQLVMGLRRRQLFVRTEPRPYLRRAGEAMQSGQP